MKRVIFSEGKNDTIFLQELLITKLALLEENKILFFNQDSEEIKANLKFIETRYFDKLDSEWLPYELLAKSEGGNKKVIDITVSQLPYLCKKGYNPIMLIDLDQGKIDTFINRLKEKLISRHRDLTIDSCELDKIEDVLIHSVKLVRNGKLIGVIYVIAFYNSLEDVTGIKDNTPNNEKRALSHKYIETSRIHDIFAKALTNS